MKKISSIAVALTLSLSQIPLVSAEAVYGSNYPRIMNFMNESFTELDISEYIEDSSLSYSVRIYECPELEVINIPEQVKEVEIISCFALKEVNVSGENTEYSSVDGVLYDKAAENLVLYPAGREDEEFAVPEGVKSIEKYAFASGSVETVVLPDSLESIGVQAFEDCTGLKSINMPASLRGECYSIFRGCDALKEITFCDTSFAPDYFSSFADEESTRFTEMLDNNSSPQIIVYAPDENFDSYWFLAGLWENKNTVIIPVSMKRDDGHIAFDVNDDGFIGIADMVTLNNFILGKPCENAVVTDIDQDGRTDSFDLVLIREILVDNRSLLY